MGIKRMVALKVAIALALTTLAVVPMGQAAAEGSKGNVVYVHNGDMAAKDSFKALLTNKGYHFRGISLENVPSFDFSNKDVVVIAADTANSYGFASKEAAEILDATKKPIMAVGTGGARALDHIVSKMGYLRGANDNWDGVYATTVKSSVWRSPFSLAPSTSTLTVLFEEPTSYTALKDEPKDTVAFADARWSDEYHPLVRGTSGDGQEAFLWGFNADPRTMTREGRLLFVNSVEKLNS